MMKAGTVNVRELYFEHQDLTQITGKPTFITIYNMVLQLKANAVPIPHMLGGGAYGYIGIILSSVTCASIAAMNPFIILAPLGPLNVTNNAT